MKKRCAILTVLLVVVCLLLAGCGSRKIYIDYTASMPEGVEGDYEQLFDETGSIIARRLAETGYIDAEVIKLGNIIRIQFPHVELNSLEIEIIKMVVGARGVLEFKDPEGNTFMTSDMFQSAEPWYDNGDWQIAFVLTPEGKNIFAEKTREYIGRQIAIYLDGEELIAPTVQTAITDGRGVINGIGSHERAICIAAQIQSGALPLELKLDKVVGQPKD